MPQDVGDLERAFPVSVGHLMPAQESIPDEFRNGHTKWNRIFSDWFYNGLQKPRFVPHKGIDQVRALRHIQTIMGSWEPQHEDKESAVAYLLSLWFKDVKYKGSRA
jgi:hypothetical protein